MRGEKIYPLPEDKISPLFVAAAITKNIDTQLRNDKLGRLVAEQDAQDLIANTAIELVQKLETLPCHAPSQFRR